MLWLSLGGESERGFRLERPVADHDIAGIADEIGFVVAKVQTRDGAVVVTNKHRAEHVRFLPVGKIENPDLATVGGIEPAFPDVEQVRAMRQVSDLDAAVSALINPHDPPSLKAFMVLEAEEGIVPECDPPMAPAQHPEPAGPRAEIEPGCRCDDEFELLPRKIDRGGR